MLNKNNNKNNNNIKLKMLSHRSITSGAQLNIFYNKYQVQYKYNKINHFDVNTK